VKVNTKTESKKMNHIKKLQMDLASSRQELQAIKDGIANLRAYLQSSKFHCGDRLDGYVNIEDVLNLIASAEDAGFMARDDF
jgi:hypothetical protein